MRFWSHGIGNSGPLRANGKEDYEPYEVAVRLERLLRVY